MLRKNLFLDLEPDLTPVVQSYQQCKGKFLDNVTRQNAGRIVPDGYIALRFTGSDAKKIKGILEKKEYPGLLIESYVSPERRIPVVVITARNDRMVRSTNKTSVRIAASTADDPIRCQYLGPGEYTACKVNGKVLFSMEQLENLDAIPDDLLPSADHHPDRMTPDELYAYFWDIGPKGGKTVNLSHVTELVTNKHPYVFWMKPPWSKEKICFDFDGMRYTADDSMLDTLREEIRTWSGDKVTNKDMSDILSHLRDKVWRPYSDVVSPAYEISFLNGRVDIRTGELKPHDPHILDLVLIPHNYDPDADSSKVREVYLKIFDGREDILERFFEQCGTIFCREPFNSWNQCMFFHSGGGSGKSTIFDALEYMVGDENYSNLSMNQVAEKFQSQMIDGKLLNIFPDESRIDMTATESKIWKMSISGEEYYVQDKNVKSWKIRPYATHFYGSNHLIKSEDRSDGFLDRICYIPLHVRFRGTPDEDKGIKDLAKTPAFAEALIAESIKGFIRYYNNGRNFTPLLDERENRQTVVVGNSSSLLWATEEAIPLARILETPRDTLYEEYCHWYKDLAGFKGNPGSRIRFEKDLIGYYGLGECAMMDGKYYFRRNPAEERKMAVQYLRDFIGTLTLTKEDFKPRLKASYWCPILNAFYGETFRYTRDTFINAWNEVKGELS